MKGDPPLIVLVFGKSPITWCPKKKIITIAINPSKVE